MKVPQRDLIVAGKYCVERELAVGGMGSVWEARHVDLDVPVAIKFMGPEYATTEEGRTRFEREAKAAAFLQCVNVVDVKDYGIDDGLAYMVMELLDGEDLADRLDRRERLTLDEALSILTHTAKALRRAQDLGIVHRDIKPQNLFLAKNEDGEEIVKVLDFGIAKETGPVLLAQGSNTGQIIGSPHYMSPEQVRGARDIDHRADLWSLGVIIFECVTGDLPFPGENVGDVMGNILADPIPDATDVAPDLPVEVNPFFRKALCRDRNERFQSAREMAEAFADVVALASSSPRKSLFSTPNPPVVSALTQSIDSKRDGGPQSQPSRGRAGVLAVAALAVVLAGVLFWAFKGGEPPRADADPALNTAAPNVDVAPAQTATGEAGSTAASQSTAAAKEEPKEAAPSDTSNQAVETAPTSSAVAKPGPIKGSRPVSTGKQPPAPRQNWGF